MGAGTRVMRAFVIAGEPSGDELARALMVGLKSLAPGTEFAGIGGSEMQAEGLQSLFPMDELSVMGFAEIAPKYFRLRRRIAQTAEAALSWQPDLMITVDSPDFCLRVARRVRTAANIRTVHYVAPTVWAWRPRRAAKMAEFIDQVLALFPFEPPYMEAAGMRCDFVGHPVTARVPTSEAEARDFRSKHGISNDATLLLVLPGSRKSEVGRLSGVFGAAAERFLVRHPDTRIVIPAARPVAAMVRRLTSTWGVKPVILDPDKKGAEADKRAAFRAADLALAASGTVSLELAAAGTPMVISYDMNWLSRRIVGRMLRTDTVTLVNLVAESRTVPEFLGRDCRPESIADALTEVLRSPAAQREAMAKTVHRLGKGGEDPGVRAARAVLDGLVRNGRSAPRDQPLPIQPPPKTRVPSVS